MAPVSRRHVLSTFVLAAAAVAGGRGSARAAAKPPLTFGAQASLWGSPAIVAEEERVFDPLEVQVSFRRFASGKATRDAMLAGQVDMGSLGGTPFIVGAAKGDLVGVGTVAYAGRTQMVVAAKGRGITSVRDLKGRRIASQRGSSTDYIFQSRFAPKHGLSGKDFQIVNLAFADHISALASGSVDAFVADEPYPTIAEAKGLGVILGDFGDLDLAPVIMAVTRGYLERRPEAVVEFLKGWLRVAAIFKEQPRKVAAVVWRAMRERGYDVTEEIIAKALSHLDVDPTVRPELLPYLAEQARTLVELGQIDRAPDWNRAFVREPLDRAIRG